MAGAQRKPHARSTVAKATIAGCRANHGTSIVASRAANYFESRFHLRIPGAHHLRGLIEGHNVIVMAGPIVVKRTGQPQRRRKFVSESWGREILGTAGIRTVPILARLPALSTFVMQRSRASTLNHHLTDEHVAAFGAHVLEVARHRLPAGFSEGYGWLDSPKRMRLHSTFVDFLVHEFGAVQQRFEAAHSQYDSKQILHCLQGAEPHPERLLVLTDIAPKNVVYDGGEFIHLDLEITLIGPPDFLLAKAAINLATDLGDRFGSRRVRRDILAQCSSSATARAVLVFSLVRRMMYEAQRSRLDPRAGHALHAALAGASLEEVIDRVEGTWGTSPQQSAANQRA